MDLMPFPFGNSMAGTVALCTLWSYQTFLNPSAISLGSHCEAQARPTLRVTILHPMTVPTHKTGLTGQAALGDGADHLNRNTHPPHHRTLR